MKISLILLIASGPLSRTVSAAKPASDLGSAIETVLDKGPDAISKIKDIFTKKKTEEPAAAEAEVVEIVESESAPESAPESEEAAQ